MNTTKTVDNFFTPEEEHKIISSIKKAELNTSGEIRLHIEQGKESNEDVLLRARKVFDALGMNSTELANGVLLYLDIVHHRFAIWGGKGIFELCPEGFWDQTCKEAIDKFKKGEVVTGLCDAIEEIGEKLKYYFPYQKGDVNELPDEISKSNV